MKRPTKNQKFKGLKTSFKIKLIKLIQLAGTAINKVGFPADWQRPSENTRVDTMRFNPSYLCEVANNCLVTLRSQNIFFYVNSRPNLRSSNAPSPRLHRKWSRHEPRRNLSGELRILLAGEKPQLFQGPVLWTTEEVHRKNHRVQLRR